MPSLVARPWIPSHLAILVSWVSFASTAHSVDSWPQWRGNQQNGVASGQDFPTRWSENSGIDWTTELAGNGGSTPVMDENTAYLTAGVDGKNMLLALNLDDGSLNWQVALGSDRGNKHKKGSGSNPSPVIDGDRVFAYFRSGDLACVDQDGKIIWQTNLQDRYGEDTLWWDLGSSPTLTKDAVIVAVMQSGPSYLMAVDKQTGEPRWKTDRLLDAPEEAAQSYSTPLVVQIDNREVIAVMGADHLTLYLAENGKEIGRLGGFNPGGDRFFRSISSPVAGDNIIICPYARGSTLTGVRLDKLSKGGGKDAIAWFRDDLGSDVPTPAAFQGRVYIVGDGRASRGLITCLDVNSGETIWTLQLPKSRIGFSSSPLIADNRLYVTSENGTTYVVGPLSDEQPQLISENRISDDAQYTVASPIPAGNSLLLRSRHNLYRIIGE